MLLPRLVVFISAVLLSALNAWADSTTYLAVLKADRTLPYVPALPGEALIRICSREDERDDPRDGD